MMRVCFPFLVPSNLFAVTSLRQLAEMAAAILHDAALANEAAALAGEVEAALRQYARCADAGGRRSGLTRWMDLAARC